MLVVLSWPRQVIIFVAAAKRPQLRRSSLFAAALARARSRVKACSPPRATACCRRSRAKLEAHGHPHVGRPASSHRPLFNPRCPRLQYATLLLTRSDQHAGVSFNSIADQSRRSRCHQQRARTACRVRTSSCWPRPCTRFPPSPAIGLVLVLSVDRFMGIARARQPDRQLRRHRRGRGLGRRHRLRARAHAVLDGRLLPPTEDDIDVADTLAAVAAARLRA